ncbi:UDP-N-acetylglucosamine pyrophosphorylase /glucosamine-1-phosphate N-acetyltransferase [Pseudonocardia thermophila]|uniref:Bifunctional protein GlmU n=1 Tax=Pseudonocardia thermophila TaxID=1848 RepID=A0A1M6RNF2_PSETH|nr:bifunctional UDP-N-acetylglucosamine diphosphorylase/glucosamine-1-phosphate N-acetyltransferase GlmU [Pseudonocardia thermophila]SHK33920.1 UDP-N-acetylglucosamine pyrophosphorylase /glucosamine-1-phosphate N-acetyltransferase [Pseudonocardia thermophila]
MPDPTGADPTTGESDRPAAVIVLAAGEGTRMRSATPKVLHRIAGRSLLGHIVHTVAGLRPEHLVVVVGHGADQVRAEIDALVAELGRPVTVAVQEKRLGTGHAVGCGLEALPAGLAGPVVVTYGDTPLLGAATLRTLVGDDAPVSVLTTELADPTGYGRIVRAADGSVAAIVEQADATPEQLAITEVNAGVYAFDAAFLRSGLERLDTANAQGELYLTDLVGITAADGRPARGVRCADDWEVRGINDRVQLAELRAELNRRLLVGWMRAGVTVVDPATTWVDVQVELGQDVVLHPGTQLHGATTIADGAEIGPDTTLTDCTVGEGATVVRTHGTGAEIGPRATVGPFTYLRPGTKLGERGKLGAFVEAKNAEIGTGSKVPHLTYVGDATIGEYSNIGASSVFVNYDGVNKHRSRIGSHVRTGSDNTFVAPVTIGDGAYTGAGTVVREDVPPGALAVSAGQQRNILGWVERKRPGTPAADAARAASSVDEEN